MTVPSIGAASARGLSLVREVGSIFRALGAKVEREVVLAGNLIDLLVHEQTPWGSSTITAVECKAYARPVGGEVVSGFIGLVLLLKERKFVHRGLIVSTSGFTHQAMAAANGHDIELLKVDDLRQRVIKLLPGVVQSAEKAFDEEEATTRPNLTRMFVVMPFSSEFQDIYILGIREVAEKLGMVVERADDIEHNGDIVGVIQDKIRNSHLILGDTTGKNPNVFYEIGFAHALRKETILIARKGSDIPFDVFMQNHIIFDTIVELRERLEKRLRQTALHKPITG